MNILQAKCATVYKQLPDDLGYATIFRSLLPSNLDSSVTLKNKLTAATIAVYKRAKVQLPVVPRPDPYYFGIGNLAGIASGLRRISDAQLTCQVWSCVWMLIRHKESRAIM